MQCFYIKTSAILEVSVVIFFADYFPWTQHSTLHTTAFVFCIILLEVDTVSFYQLENFYHLFLTIKNNNYCVWEFMEGKYAFYQKKIIMVEKCKTDHKTTRRRCGYLLKNLHFFFCVSLNRITSKKSYYNERSLKTWYVIKTVRETCWLLVFASPQPIK